MLSMCVCVPDVLVCGMFGCEPVNCVSSQPNIPQTSTSGTHTQTTYSHIPNKQLDTNKQRSRNSTKHERRTPEDGQTIVTETCRGFN